MFSIQPYDAEVDEDEKATAEPPLEDSGASSESGGSTTEKMDPTSKSEKHAYFRYMLLAYVRDLKAKKGAEGDRRRRELELRWPLRKDEF